MEHNDDDVILNNWNSWSVFVPRTEQTAVQLVQQSPWAVSREFLFECIRQNCTTVTPSDDYAAGHIKSELIRKAELQQFISTVEFGQNCDYNNQSLSIKSFDPFTLKSTVHTFNMSLLPNSILVPDNHGFILSLNCSGKSAAKISCSGSKHSPCVHSFVRSNYNRSKRSLSGARRMLAEMTARNPPIYVSPYFPSPFPAVSSFQKRSGAEDTNGTGNSSLDHRQGISKKAAKVILRSLVEQVINESSNL
jgi:hypothetical protein